MANHRIYMHYQFTMGSWYISFLEADCRTSLALTLHFRDEAKIREIHTRYGSQILEDKQALDHGIDTGRGGIWLTLDEEQYQTLRRPTTQKSRPA